MKKMKIEKQLIFADHVKRIVSLQAQENLTYRHEEDGIRAMGPLYIKGEYEGDSGIEQFQETLELDVLAPNDKLGSDAFQLQVVEVKGKHQDDCIQVVIDMNIHGLKVDQEQDQTAKSMALPTIEVPKTKKQEIHPNTLELSNADTISQKADHEAIPENDIQVETTMQEKTVVDDFEDIFADAQSTYTSYRIIVAKPNDTYTAIAQRYDVEESALRDTNKNKEILPKTLVILPFLQQS